MQKMKHRWQVAIFFSSVFIAYHAGLYTGGSRGFNRTPYFCCLKLILSLNIKYCMIMCATVCRNLHSGILWMLKYHNFVSVWGLPHLRLPTRSNYNPLLKSLRTGLSRIIELLPHVQVQGVKQSVCMSVSTVSVIITTLNIWTTC